ncbi:MAG: hypothetical protein U0470_10605 [Anaerolineae bacterium]
MPTQRIAALIAPLGLGLSVLSFGACRAPSQGGGTSAVVREGALAPAPQQRIIAQWGGQVHGLVVDGKRAYFGHGMHVVVADVGRPATPRVLGESPVLADSVRAIALARGLIVAHVGDGVQLVDITRPSRPALRGRFALDDALAGIAARGRMAYLLTAGGSLHIVDLRNPDVPVEIAVVDGLPQDGAIGTNDATVFVAGEDLAAVDVRRPERAAVVGRAPITGTMIHVDGGRAYVWGEDPPTPGVVDRIGWPVRFKVVDVRRPKDMHVLHEAVSDTRVRRAISDGRSYMFGAAASGACCTVHVVDYAKPVAPVDMGVGEVRLSDDSIYDVVVDGDRMYALGPFGGLHILDGSRPGAPVELGTLPIVASANDAAADGAVLYAITGRPNGGSLLASHRFVDTFDLADAGAPRQLGRLAITMLAYRIAHAEGRLYLRGGNGITMLDARAPADLRQIVTLVVDRYRPANDPGNRKTVALAHGADVWFTDLTAVGEHVGAVKHASFGDPKQPLVADQIDLDMAPIDIAEEGAHLYVAERPASDAVRRTQSGVRIFDVATAAAGMPAAHAREVGYLPVPDPLSDIAVVGGRLYALGGALRIFDLGAPTEPTPLGSLNLDATPVYVGLAVDGTTAYLGAQVGFAGPFYQSKVLVVDVSDPAQPRVVDSEVEHPGRSRG